MQGMTLVARRSLVPLLVAFSAALAFAPGAFAKRYEPNTRVDHAPNGCTHSDCTLREAIISANSHPGSDKIVLRAGKTYVRSPALNTQEDAAASGDLDITDSLTIRSASKRKRAIVDGGATPTTSNGSVFENRASAKFVRLKIQHGSEIDGGGVHAVAGSTRVVSSVVSANRAAFGGGIETSSSASLSIDRSTISGNVATVFLFTAGGGIDAGGPTKITNSTISGNIAHEGGIASGAGGIAIFGIGTVATLTNVTIDGNRADEIAGGIEVGGGATVNLNAVTVAHNVADANGNGSGDGGGLFIGPGGVINVRNSLIATNADGGGQAPDCSGSTTSLGHNLLGTTLGCTIAAAGGDIFNPSASQIRLGTLKGNGGPTKTDALKRHSLAINHAGPGSPKRDQRGEKRKKPDIGAFERT
jgi:hypothetical protein